MALAAGIAELAESGGRPGRLEMSEPYFCEGEAGSAISPYAVAFKLFSEVLDLGGRQVKIGDFNGFVGRGIGAGSCSFEIPVEPELVFSHSEGTRYYGGIVVGVPSCDELTVAEKIVDNLVRQPDVPEPRPGAQRIGDLR